MHKGGEVDLEKRHTMERHARGQTSVTSFLSKEEPFSPSVPKIQQALQSTMTLLFRAEFVERV